MEVSNLSDKKFRVIVIRMLTKLGRKTDEQSENFKNDTGKIRKYPTEVIRAEEYNN